MSRRIVIAGAGIAGMTAAINLARKGADVEVLEVRSDVGARFAGDFQFFENWSQNENVLESLQRMNIRLDFPAIPVLRATAYDDHYRRYEFHAERPVMYIVRRGRFDGCIDSCLRDQACASGVRIRFNTRADPVCADIVATGPEPKMSRIYVRGASFETDLDHDVRVLFDPGIAPGVYAYLVAHEKMGVVCAAYSRRRRRRKKGRDFVVDAIAAFQRTGAFEVRRVSYFANFGVGPVITRHRQIIIGEAAGFQDAAWGFGMRMAVQSGYLAARSIIENKDYWDLADEDIVPLVASTAVNGIVWDVLGRHATRALLRVLSRSENKISVLQRCYTPYRWKMLAFRLARLTGSAAERSEHRGRLPR